MFRRDFIFASFLSFFGIKTKIPNGLNEVKIENGEILNGEELLGNEPFRIDEKDNTDKDGTWANELQRISFYRAKKVWLNKKDAILPTGLTQPAVFSDQPALTLNGRILLSAKTFQKFYGEVLIFQLLFVGKEGNYSRFYIKPMLSSIFVDVKLDSNKKKYHFTAGWMSIKQIPNTINKELALEDFFKGE